MLAGKQKGKNICNSFKQFAFARTCLLLADAAFTSWLLACLLRGHVLAYKHVAHELEMRKKCVLAGKQKGNSICNSFKQFARTCLLVLGWRSFHKLLACLLVARPRSCLQTCSAHELEMRKRCVLAGKQKGNNICNSFNLNNLHELACLCSADAAFTSCLLACLLRGHVLAYKHVARTN